MTHQPDFLPWLNALVALLLSGIIFFVKRLLDRIEKTLEGQAEEVRDLQIKVAVHESHLKLGKKPCPSERKEKQNESVF